MITYKPSIKLTILTMRVPPS